MELTQFASAGQSALRAISSGTLPHACIVSGDQFSCAEFARAVAKAYLNWKGDIAACPDLVWLSAPKVDDIRALIGELAKKPFGDFGRFVAIECAQPITPQAQNALLKTLEEPPGRTVLFLLGDQSAFLPTIRSRCALLRPPEIASHCGEHNDDLTRAAIALLRTRGSDTAAFAAIAKDTPDAALDELISLSGQLLRHEITGESVSGSVCQLAGHFTTRAINAIIDLAIECKKRRALSANIPLLLDRLFVQLGGILGEAVKQ